MSCAVSESRRTLELEESLLLEVLESEKLIGSNKRDLKEIEELKSKDFRKVVASGASEFKSDPGEYRAK